jgi:hypothetical protein
MNDDQLYSAWRAARAEAPAPPGFSERVMTSVREYRDTGILLTIFAALSASRAGRAGLLALGGACFVYRAACSLRIFLEG